MTIGQGRVIIEEVKLGFAVTPPRQSFSNSDAMKFDGSVLVQAKEDSLMSLPGILRWRKGRCICLQRNDIETAKRTVAGVVGRLAESGFVRDL